MMAFSIPLPALSNAVRDLPDVWSLPTDAVVVAVIVVDDVVRATALLAAAAAAAAAKPGAVGAALEYTNQPC